MTNKKNIAIINYGNGNIQSIINALPLKNCNYDIYNNKCLIGEYDCIIIPGMGNYSKLSQKLREKENFKFLKNHLAQKKKLIGICLGFQVMVDFTHELKKSIGLSIFSGVVSQIKNKKHHIGWNKIKFNNKKSLFADFNNDFFYFNHGFMYKPSIKSEKLCSAVAVHDGLSIPALIEMKNIIGFQFHPEKSQDKGIEILNRAILG